MTIAVTISGDGTNLGVAFVGVARSTVLVEDGEASTFFTITQHAFRSSSVAARTRDALLRARIPSTSELVGTDVVANTFSIDITARVVSDTTSGLHNSSSGGNGLSSSRFVVVIVSCNSSSNESCGLTSDDGSRSGSSLVTTSTSFSHPKAIVLLATCSVLPGRANSDALVDGRERRIINAVVSLFALGFTVDGSADWKISALASSAFSGKRSVDLTNTGRASFRGVDGAISLASDIGRTSSGGSFTTNAVRLIARSELSLDVGGGAVDFARNTLLVVDEAFPLNSLFVAVTFTFIKRNISARSRFLFG